MVSIRFDVWDLGFGVVEYIRHLSSSFVRVMVDEGSASGELGLRIHWVFFVAPWIAKMFRV